MANHNRTLTFKIYRHDPKDPASVPHFDTFTVQDRPFLSVYLAMEEIQQNQDPSLYYDICCRSNVCGSCAVNVNGQPRLACKTQTKDLPDISTIEPLRYFDHIKDVAVDKGRWYMEMTRRLEGWIHTSKPFNEKVENIQKADEQIPVYQAERCIECGICIEACGATHMNPKYLGSAGMNRAYRFLMDTRDERSLDEFAEQLFTENGVFGCEAMLGCRNFCPKEIPLPYHFGILRKRILSRVLLGKK
ncbi:MAG: fumarate reductase iron-sulfur subunit [bacterium]|nr:fumarate reductase iron-sulfur subunit [bacterium]